MSDPSTHFGYRAVPESQKSGLVKDVFDSVADKYDVMNDLMSLGAHRLWKRFAISQGSVGKGARVLDVAAGSGDLGLQFATRVGTEGMVVLTDVNAAMLNRGRDRLTDAGVVGNVHYVQGDAEGS